LDDFSQQIELLHQSRVQLLDRLTRSHSIQQQRQQEREIIIMDPQFHRDFVDLFYRIQEELPKMDGHLKALETWKQDSGLMGQHSSSVAAALPGSTLDRLVRVHIMIVVDYSIDHFSISNNSLTFRTRYLALLLENKSGWSDGTLSAAIGDS
jgi:hypothetical protein